MYEVIGPQTHLSVSQTGMALLSLLIVWDLIWKGIALWKSARNDQLGWFVAIAILNTVGILPIVYVLFFQRRGTKRR